MISNPFIPGTFWRLADGRRYLIDGFGRFTYLDGPIVGRPAGVVPDTTDATQLHLVPSEATHAH